jgi:hypothetical protein
MQTTKQGERMWYSIQTTVVGEKGLQRVKGEEWEWARKDWRKGVPNEFPEYTEWSKEEWVD